MIISITFIPAALSLMKMLPLTGNKGKEKNHHLKTYAFTDIIKRMHKAMNNEDPADYKIPDDRYRGVFALSNKILFNDFALQTALTALHNRAIAPSKYWQAADQFQSINGNTIIVQNSYSNEKDHTLNNSAFAARFGGTIKTFDFHLIYYTGMNTVDVFRPLVVLDDTSSLPFILIESYYDRVHSFGADTAFTLNKLSLRSELAFTYDLPAFKEADSLDYSKAFTQASSNRADVYKVVKSEKQHYLSYVIGADYNLWGDYGLLLVEWMQGFYLTDNYNEPLYNKLLLIRIEDKYYNEQIF